MKTVQIIFFLLISAAVFAQDFKDTIWFNKKWEECQKPLAAFYRIYKKTDKGYLVYDKYLNGKNQMVAEASQVKPKVIEEGYSVYYNEDGSKDKRGYSKNDERVGIWVSYFENEKDSSIYEYINNQPVKYIRKSALQKEEIFSIVEKQAEFPGGIAELSKFIQTNLVYPENARKFLLGGKVLLKFVVDEEGYISADVEVVKSSGSKEMDEEAVRVVKVMPQWKPASMTGKNVKCYFHLPITYSLAEPFYLNNTLNKNEQYLKIAGLIFEGKAAEAYFLAKEVDDNTSDADMLYNKAILYFVYTDRNKSCEVFKKVTQVAEQGGNIYKNSTRFYTQYCN